MKTNSVTQKWSLLIMISIALVGLTFPSDGVLRVLAMLWFLFVCPGLSFVQLLDLRPAWFVLTISVALSLAVGGLVAGTMAYTQNWNPDLALGVLIVLSILGVVIAMLRFNKSQPVDILEEI